MTRPSRGGYGDLLSIPGVGKKIAEDLVDLGIRAVADLKGRDPEDLYGRLCARAGKRVDRCMLYVFRCAVYYASNDRHEPALLKWWNWKDGRSSGLSGRD
jgi:hypothetical protein